MQKYVLTKKNINDMIGRIRKFLNSCNEFGIYDYAVYRKSMTRCYGKFWSMRPSGENVSIIADSTIHFDSPINMDIIEGSVIYFIGGNKLVIRRMMPNLYTGKLELESFPTAYERCKPSYEVLN